MQISTQFCYNFLRFFIKNVIFYRSYACISYNHYSIFTMTDNLADSLTKTPRMHFRHRFCMI